MQFARRILLWLSTLLMHTALVLFVASLSVIFLFGEKQALKDVLIESGVYTSFVDAVIADNVKTSANQLSSLPLDDPEIQKIAKQAFSPTALKNETESFVDKLYEWLNGEADSLTFEVELNPQKEVFIEMVSTYAANRLVGLPTCETVSAQNTTIFALSCRPENVPLEFVKNQVHDDLEGSSFFKDIRFTQDDLPKTKSGAYIHQELAFVPPVLRALRTSLWTFVAVFLLASALFVSVRRPLRKGFKLYGRDLLSNGGTLLVATVVFGFVIPKFTNGFNIQGNETVSLTNKISDTYIRHFDVLIINVALQVAACGLIIVMLERLSRPESKYRQIRKKSGLTTSYARSKVVIGKVVHKPLPPIQTSEGRKKSKTKSRASKKYRKIGIE
jgi:hypothetical protein